MDGSATVRLDSGIVPRRNNLGGRGLGLGVELGRDVVMRRGGEEDEDFLFKRG